ncbi:MAG: hypothetical protein JHC61_14965 [Burkholderiaceae bacterium]|nr:hypothetical protein [Burkholderiaceae bacterium]
MANRYAAASMAILMVYGHWVFAAPPPVVVYRVDTRSPNEIFIYGFRAWGNNHNIVSHVTGESCVGPNPSTAFISTMTNTDAVETLVRNHLREAGRHTTYVYAIRADSNFYNAAASIDNIQRRNPLVPLTIASLEMARRAGEWDAIAHIPTENIISASVRFSNGTRVRHQNLGYAPGNTHANRAVYTGHIEETLLHYRLSVRTPDNVTLPMSACFAACFMTGPARHPAAFGNTVNVEQRCPVPAVYSVEAAAALIIN